MAYGGVTRSGNNRALSSGRRAASTAPSSNSMSPWVLRVWATPAMSPDRSIIDTASCTWRRATVASPSRAAT